MDGEGEYSKEKGKIRQGAIATGLQVPRDGQAGLTNKKNEKWRPGMSTVQNGKRYRKKRARPEMKW